VVFNVALKFLLVWGLHFGAAGLALGTSLGAWLNVGVLVWLALDHDFLSIQTSFLRALGPVIAAALATGALALGGAELAEHLLHPGLLRDEGMLAAAILAGGVGYGAVTLMFRSVLPLGRLSGARA
jgi:putative peptidoglycan lipid II flippase